LDNSFDIKNQFTAQRRRKSQPLEQTNNVKTNENLSPRLEHSFTNHTPPFLYFLYYFSVSTEQSAGTLKIN
jgi:hypothetical protein